MINELEKQYSKEKLNHKQQEILNKQIMLFKKKQHNLLNWKQEIDEQKEKLL